jgi:NAD(P)H-flavin reductase
MPYTIVRREAFSDTTFLWDVEAPDVAASAQPGHFVMLRLREGGERIPLTVADFDRKKGTITMVVQTLGKTTREMMTDYNVGDTFADFVGPLGLPQHIEKKGHVVLVGGGLGVAPVYPQLRAFKEAGNRTTGVIGFRNKDLVFWEQKFGKYCDSLVVCTDDGSYGKPGFVTQALKEICEKDKPDLVVAIGPLPMMNACVETTRPFGVKTMVSLNAIMVDGTGMFGEWGCEAVFLATGAGTPVFMGIPGEGLCGVYSANEFLTRVNLMGAWNADSDTPVLHGQQDGVHGDEDADQDAGQRDQVEALRAGLENGRLVQIFDLRFGNPMSPGFTVSATVNGRFQVVDEEFNFRPRPK